MWRNLYLLLGFLLAACTAQQASASPTADFGMLVQPVPTFTPTFLPATPTAYPTVPFPPTDTLTRTPTETKAATETPISYVYVFPLQPAEATGFEEGTASHGYPATDIFAPVGTKFVAVTDGVVDFVSYEDLWNPDQDDPAIRGGLSVAIIGDDGLRYYGSHLSAIAAGIAPGIPVKSGDLLGLVGNSGNARATLSHLHFGISRPSTPDDWKARRGQVDPFPFLQAWRDGHNVTPPLPILPSETPTSTPNLYSHVFPIQPPGAGNFSEGGHAYPATDIFAPAGTKFVAVTNGTVEEVSNVDLWDPANPEKTSAGGISIRILGDDGVRYYGAHLSAIAAGIRPGVWVAAGQMLGLVGNSGDARNTTPHVHFEISNPVSPSTLVDPFPYLVAWRDGQNITPLLPTP